MMYLIEKLRLVGIRIMPWLKVLRILFSSSWVSMNFSLLAVLPSNATMNPISYLDNFSSTLTMAELLLDTTWTVLPRTRILAMMFRIVCVFPVPGGPCTTLIWFSKAAWTAFCWLALQPKGKSRLRQSGAAFYILRIQVYSNSSVVCDKMNLFILFCQ